MCFILFHEVLYKCNCSKILNAFCNKLIFSQEVALLQCDFFLLEFPQDVWACFYAYSSVLSLVRRASANCSALISRIQPLHLERHREGQAKQVRPHSHMLVCWLHTALPIELRNTCLANTVLALPYPPCSPLLYPMLWSGWVSSGRLGTGNGSGQAGTERLGWGVGMCWVHRYIQVPQGADKIQF